MKKLLHRASLLRQLTRSIHRAPVTLLVGPRQCGKSTTARIIAAKRPSAFFDLEDPSVALRAEVAAQVLSPLRGLVVIDEMQRQPSLLQLLRVLADRSPLRARFLILGSASPSLVRGASESLAGRVSTVQMSGFSACDLQPQQRGRLWLRGGFPRSFLARTESESIAWREAFVSTFLERDVPQLGIRVPAPALRRFFAMLAHYHGQILNAADLARSLGGGENAVRHHLDIFTGMFLVRQLQPWFENVGKRLVKAPRLYVRDSGILHYLLNVRTRLDLMADPRLGASWEGFVIDQVIGLLDAENHAYFYRTYAGAEIDLLIVRGRRRWGFEMKVGDTPSVTKSMRVAQQDLGLDHLFVVHPGDRSTPLAEGISSLSLTDLHTVRERCRDV